MPNQELINYIKQAKEIGQDDEKIKSDLRSAGWQEGDIEEGFSAVLGAPLPPFAAPLPVPVVPLSLPAAPVSKFRGSKKTIFILAAILGLLIIFSAVFLNWALLREGVVGPGIISKKARIIVKVDLSLDKTKLILKLNDGSIKSVAPKLHEMAKGKNVLIHHMDETDISISDDGTRVAYEIDYIGSEVYLPEFEYLANYNALHVYDLISDRDKELTSSYGGVNFGPKWALKTPRFLIADPGTFIIRGLEIYDVDEDLRIFDDSIVGGEPSYLISPKGNYIAYNKSREEKVSCQEIEKGVIYRGAGEEVSYGELVDCAMPSPSTDKWIRLSTVDAAVVDFNGKSKVIKRGTMEKSYFVESWENDYLVIEEINNMRKEGEVLEQKTIKIKVE